MFVRFVVGLDDENPYWLDGIFTVAGTLFDDGELYRHELELLRETFDWFKVNLPVPPFRRKLRSGEWSPSAHCWFRPEAGEPLRRIWDIVAILREHGTPVRLVTTNKPGKIVYRDRYQVVAETVHWA